MSHTWSSVDIGEMIQLDTYTYSGETAPRLKAKISLNYILSVFYFDIPLL